MYSGEYLEHWIERKLAEKKIYTFADLPQDRLQIIASNLSKGKILQLPKDVEEIGLTARKLKVSKAVRMSISIPFLFDPLKVKKESTQYIVDGGVMSNFPVWIFDHDSPETVPTFGFNLRSKNPEHFYKIRDPFSMLYAIISIMLESQDLKYIENQDAVRTIFVPTEGVKSTDFSLNKKTEELLFNAGEKAAKKFFRTWNFDDYVIRYVQSRKIDSVKKVI
jgi:NTE family protein